MTNNSDPSQPTSSIFGPKADPISPLPVDEPDSSAAHAAAIKFVTSATGPIDAIAGLRARCEVIEAATVAVHAALQVIVTAGAPVPPQPSEVAGAKVENAASRFERPIARWEAERAERTAAAEQQSVTSSPAGHAVPAKAPRMSRLVHDLAIGKTVTLPGAVGSPAGRSDRFMLSPRDEVIVWLLARYRCITVIDLATYFGGPTTSHTLQMRGNQLERAGLIRRYTQPGRIIVWELTREGQFVAGVHDAPALPRKLGPTGRELVAACVGLAWEAKGCRVATRRELLAGHFFHAPATSQLAGASTSLDLVAGVEVGHGVTHCPDFMARRVSDDGSLSAPISVDLVLGSDPTAHEWRQILVGYSGLRLFEVVVFVTTDPRVAHQIHNYLAAGEPKWWVQVARLHPVRHLVF